MTLKELITVASKSSEKIFRKDGYLCPLYHMVQPDGTNMLWPAEGETKDETVINARIIMRRYDIESYVFIDEAWILETKTRTPAEDAEVMRFCNEFGVKAHPDRREVLMFYAESKRGEQLMGRRFILRPEHGKPTLSPLQFTGAEHLSGRMTGLLS